MMTLMMRNCCEVLLVILIIQQVLLATLILMNLNLIHVYNPALPGRVLLHHSLYILVSLLRDVIF